MKEQMGKKRCLRLSDMVIDGHKNQFSGIKMNKEFYL